MTVRAVLSIASCLLVAGCMTFGGSGSLDASAPGVMRGGTPPPAAAQSLAPPGATKAQVAQALGRANVIAFDSGWEVWVYRWPGANPSTRAATELVVLFDASGAVRKSRVRQGG